jgi:hypothetical protein
MKNILSILIIILIYVVITIPSQAQQFKIKSYSIGVRTFEITPVGNNPLTLGSLLKDPDSYMAFLNSTTYNTIFGSPEIRWRNTIYFNAEWTKKNSTSGFWKRNSISTGFNYTPKITLDAGSIADEDFIPPAYTTKYSFKYVTQKQEQKAGLNTGLNSRFKIIKNVNFLTGIHFQGSVAFQHKIKQYWDSSYFNASSGWTGTITDLPDLKGKNYFEWQAFIPLSFEYDNRNKKLAVRLELDAGIIQSQFRPRGINSNSVSNGFGVFVNYRID